MDWKAAGRKKKDSVNALIPEHWLLKSPVPSVEEQKDVTGKYIQQFLTPKEVEITETDAVGIVKNTTSGAWTAREVTEAFCHRAALAHQLVPHVSKAPTCAYRTECLFRSTVFMKYSSQRP
jgi:amidase